MNFSDLNPAASFDPVTDFIAILQPDALSTTGYRTKKLPLHLFFDAITSLANNPYWQPVTPKMRFNSQFGYVASASSSLVGTDYIQPWMAFDGEHNNSMTGGWLTASTSTGWIQIQLPIGYACTNVIITGWYADSYPNRCPKDFTIQGSLDGTNWVTLTAQTNVTVWGDNANQKNRANKYAWANAIKYTYYRLNVTANNGDAYLGIRQLELY